MHLTERRARHDGLLRHRRRAPDDRPRRGLVGAVPGSESGRGRFFGDGTTNIGAFHEALNLAAVWKLPGRLRLREQPLHGVHVHRRRHVGAAVRRPTARRRIGLEPIVVDGNDADAVYLTASTALERARSGDGPSLIEARDLPPRRPLAGRSGQVPAGGRGRRVAGPRPDHAVPRHGCSTRASTEAELDGIDTGRAAEVDARDRRGEGRRPPPGASRLMTDVWADGGSAWRN